MFRARQKVTARWAKSRHTPARLLNTSTAVANGEVLKYPNLTSLFTQSQIACTRLQPGGDTPNKVQASLASSCDGQNRLGSV